MRRNKKSLLALLCALTMLVSLFGCTKKEPAPAPAADPAPVTDPTTAAPETWKPAQSVELVIPYSAGGSSDLLGRAVEAVWSKHCDQPLVVTNMPGGGGVTGSMYISAAKPDGYTIGLAYGSGCDMSMPYLQEMEYDPFEALDPLCLLSVHSVVIVAPADSKFDSIADLMKWSETTGKPILVSSSTASGTVGLAFSALQYYTGANMNIVPHDGTAGSMTDLLSGSFHIGGGHPSDIAPFVASGQMKILGVATESRDASVPDAPTLIEQGVDYFNYGSIKGVSVPKNMPTEIKEYYEDLFKQITEDAEFIQMMKDLSQPVMYMDTAEFTKFFADANAGYKQTIEDMGLAYYS